MGPRIIYGTAWKQEATKALVLEAAAAGYRAFDTANQKKHYREDFAGEALLELMKGGLAREALFLQSKYTYQDGQDHRLPYDPNDPFALQVRDSLEGSLANLHTDHLDAYLLHGPSGEVVFDEADWEVWGAMEALQRAGKVRAIGVSNVRLTHLRELHERAAVKPAIVQNRCYAVRGWDQGVREFCAANGIVYQGFSLLTANPQVVASVEVGRVAQRLRVTREQVVFALARALGITPLTGTTDPGHMRQDLAALSLELSQADVAALSARLG